MKNLKIVSNGNKNVSIIDTFLLEKLMNSYVNSMSLTSTKDIVSKHIDELRKNITDLEKVIQLNIEFNQIQIFNDTLHNYGMDKFEENHVEDSSKTF